MGERFDLDELRVTSGETDPADQVLDDCETATGERPTGCPWRAFADPWVIEVIRARKWRKDGELSARYPSGVPVTIAWGIEVYDDALNAVQVADIRADREKREAEARERESKR